jgi:hypothetical protein
LVTSSQPRYLCIENQCVLSTTGAGVGLEVCFSGCGDGQRKYRCVGDQCVLAVGGVALEMCKAVCGP